MRGGGAAACLALTAACAHTPFVSVEGGFSIRMPPGMTHEKTRSVDTALGHVETEIFTATRHGVTYFVVREKYAEGTLERGGPQAYADAAESEALHPKNKRIEEHAVDIDGTPGRELTLSSARGTETLLRIVVSRSEVYRFGVEYPKGRPPPDLVDYLSSFRLARR